VEQPFPTPGGTKYLQTRIAPEFGANGQVESLLAITHDITEHKQIEEALRASETRYRRLIESITDYIYTVRVAEGQAMETRHGPGCVAITGYTSEEFAADPYLWLHMVASEDRAGVLAQAEQVLAGQDPPPLEHRLTRKDGAVRWVRNTPVLHCDVEGRLLSYDGLIQDITERKLAEEALRATRDQLVSITDNIPILIAHFSADSRYRYVNEIHARFLGRAKADIIGRHVREVIGEESYANTAPYIERVLGGEPVAFENTASNTDGELRNTFVQYTPERDEHGRVIGYFTLIQDITERKRAEEALRRSEERFSKAFHVSPIGMNLARLSDRRIADVNQADLEIFGFTREEVIGKTVQELGIILLSSEWEGVYKNLERTGSLRSAEKQLRRKDGALRDVLISSEVLDLNNEKHALWLHLDITDRRQAEEALRKSEAQLANALNIAHLGHWEYDVDQDQFLFNDHFYRIFRTTAEQIGGYTMSSAEYTQRFVHPEDAPVVGREIQQAMETTDPNFSRQLEHRIFYADGEVGYITVRIFVTKDERGRTVKTYGVNQDITERKQAEDKIRQLNAELEQRVAARTAELSARSSELQQANAELRRANRLKDEFLANMSHELRTPLTAILGLAEALQMDSYGPLLEKQAQMLQVIHQSGQHLLALITDILDLAKIEAGKAELRLAPTVAAEVCQASLQFIKQTAQKKNVRVMFASDPQVRLIQADARRLKQMLVNLLNNAVKFTPEDGQIGLEVMGDTAQHEVRFTVWDTGIGLSPEEQAMLFQPFMQVDGSLTRRYEGAGLGLALTRRLAEMHGGRMSVESLGADQGSRFTLTLPWQPAEMPPSRTADKALAPATLALPSGRSPLILLADDNEATLVAIGDFLHSLSADIVTAQTGQEALTQAQAVKPDLILMDIQMPDLDGLEAIRRLKAASATAQIPIIALTALAMSGDRERCLEAGANAYLSKPVKLVELLQVIAGLLTA
jgi:PAS domain S-box-containing protein